TAIWIRIRRTGKVASARMTARSASACSHDQSFACAHAPAFARIRIFSPSRSPVSGTVLSAREILLFQPRQNIFFDVIATANGNRGEMSRRFAARGYSKEKGIICTFLCLSQEEHVMGLLRA